MESIDAIELTQQLVRLDSSNPGYYEGKIGSFITKWFGQTDAEVIRREVLPGRYNIMARLPGQTEAPSLIFICHMDTVGLGDGWNQNPLSGEIQDGKLYGRGSCDMKAGLASALCAFAHIARKNASLKHPLIFIGTVDEEGEMAGVEAAIADGWIGKDSWVLDTEPTDSRIQVSHKGRTWFEITVQGVTAHASMPEKGADAIAGMAYIITFLREQIAKAPRHPELGMSTTAFGQISGGYSPYVVSDTCRLSLDMRLVPPMNSSRAEETVKAAIAKARQQVPGIQAGYCITGDRPPIEKNESSYLLSQLKASCLSVTGYEAPVTPFPGYTDTAVIAGTLNNPNCMSYGPGSLSLAHKPNEYVPCPDITRCTQVLTDLAQRLCL